VNGQLHAPAPLPQGKEPLVGIWDGLGAGLDALNKRKISCLPGFEPEFHGRPIRNPSLYRLSYTGSSNILRQGPNFKLKML
jgi:hypothetical protein